MMPPDQVAEERQRLIEVVGQERAFARDLPRSIVTRGVGQKRIEAKLAGERVAAAHAAASVWSAFIPCRKSAARCACAAAVNIARRSFFSTSIHEAI